MLYRHVTPHGDSVQKLVHWRVTSFSRDALPEFAQYHLKDSEHPDQIGSLQIVMAGADIAHPKVPRRRDARWIR